MCYYASDKMCANFILKMHQKCLVAGHAWELTVLPEPPSCITGVGRDNRRKTGGEGTRRREMGGVNLASTVISKSWCL